MSSRDGSHPDWRRCIYCGRYISYADFDAKRAGQNFTPDTAFTSEEINSYHVKCRDA